MVNLDADAKALEVRMDDDGGLRVLQGEEIGSDRLAHGYALTVHRSGRPLPRTVAAAQGANQGVFVLASRRPAVRTDTHDHGGRGPSRNDAARAATPIASTASATCEPVGAVGGSIGSRRCAHAAKNTAARDATARNRRSHPRTVEGGRSTRSAALRWPAPAAASVNAAPITATVSTRRPSTASGSSSCVERHERHRARRGCKRHRASLRTQHPPAGKPPTAQRTAARAGHHPRGQVALDALGVAPYDQHRCLRHQRRTPSRIRARRSEGVLARSGPPHAVVVPTTRQGRTVPVAILAVSVARPRLHPQ